MISGYNVKHKVTYSELGKPLVDIHVIFKPVLEGVT